MIRCLVRQSGSFISYCNTGDDERHYDTPYKNIICSKEDYILPFNSDGAKYVIKFDSRTRNPK